MNGTLLRLSLIETALQSIDEVDGGVAVVYHAGEEDQTIVAFVVLSFDGLLGERDRKINKIEHELQSKFCDIDSLHVEIVDSIPLLLNGKIDRQTLLEAYEKSIERSEWNITDFIRLLCILNALLFV